MKHKNTGFTLIEMMVVVVILGIIAAIAIPSYNNYIERSRIATARTKLQENATTLGKLYLRKNSYASATDVLGTQNDDYFTYTVASSTASTYRLKAETNGDIKKDVYFDSLGTTYICPIDENSGNSSISDIKCEKK